MCLPINLTLFTQSTCVTKCLPIRCSERNWLSLGPLPTLSVVVTFGDFESNYNILHTTHALVERTPQEVLKEIIIVADDTKKGNTLFLQLSN